MEPWRLATLLALAPGALAAQRTAAPPASGPAAVAGVIATGETVRDSLGWRDILLPAEGTYAQQWRFAGSAGETVTIDLASDAFDAYLFLLGPGFETEPPQDDDSGGRCNARLTVLLPATGDYFIVVTSTDKAATGPYALTLTPGAKPTSLTPCLR